MTLSDFKFVGELKNKLLWSLIDEKGIKIGLTVGAMVDP